MKTGPTKTAVVSILLSGLGGWLGPGAHAQAVASDSLITSDESKAKLADDPRYLEILGEQTVRSDHPVVSRMTVLVKRIYLQGPGSGEVQYECPASP